MTLIHWNLKEAKERSGSFRDAGFKVRLEVDPRQGPAILRRLRETPPQALVIALDRLPMQGRDIGLAIRTGKQTRFVPLVFVGGDPAKLEGIRQTMPDAVYASWAGAVAALKRAVAAPIKNPVVPSSNLAGYSGTPLPKKLGIKPCSAVALLNEPDNFVELLGALPEGCALTGRIRPGTELVIWFVRSSADLASQIDSVATALGGTAHLWICWAKRTSPLAADVTEPAVRTAGLAAGLVDYKIAAIDADWSGLKFAPRRADIKPRRPGK